MNGKVDVVRMWHDESWTNPPASFVEAIEKYYSDDFQSLDKEGNVTGDKVGMMTMSKVLYGSMEGFKGVAHDFREGEDGSVLMTFHFEGKHTGDLDLSVLGLGVIQATGKSFKTADSINKFFVKDGLIVSSQPISGGFEYVLAQLGVMPTA